jgi:hypothetical protein
MRSGEKYKFFIGYLNTSFLLDTGSQHVIIEVKDVICLREYTPRARALARATAKIHAMRQLESTRARKLRPARAVARATARIYVTCPHTPAHNYAPTSATAAWRALRAALGGQAFLYVPTHSLAELHTRARDCAPGLRCGRR